MKEKSERTSPLRRPTPDSRALGSLAPFCNSPFDSSGLSNLEWRCPVYATTPANPEGKQTRTMVGRSVTASSEGVLNDAAVMVPRLLHSLAGGQMPVSRRNVPPPRLSTKLVLPRQCQSPAPMNQRRLVGGGSSAVSSDGWFVDTPAWPFRVLFVYLYFDRPLLVLRRC